MKQILLVEDEAAHAELIHRGLARSVEPFNITTVRTLIDARNCLTRLKPDLALVDCRLPDGQGDELVELSAGTFPVVVLTAYGSERAAVQAIQAGALDYVVKSPETFDDMEHVVNRALRGWEHQAERRKAERRLESINQCLLNLGPDFQQNAGQLVSLLGRELDAHLVLYNRLAGDQMRVVAHWQRPPEFPLVFQAEGSTCYEVVRQDAPASLCIPDLFETRFAKETPLLRRLSLRAYAGHVVHCEGKAVGSLCAVFNRVHHPSDVDLRLLAILALALGSEETRCQAEKRLRESEQQYRELFELAPSNILVLDATGRVLDANPAFCQRMGYKREKLIGRLVTDFSQESPETVRHNIHRLLAGETLEHEVTNIHQDGAPRHYELREAAIKLPDGSPAILAISNDVTERKLAEQERLEMERRLLHSQKLESLGVLAGGIAHDFNNLLTAILGNLEIAQMDIHEGSPAQSNLREAAVATRRAADLTRQMLAYSGRGRFVIKALDLSEVVEEMTQLLKVSIAKTATLQLHLDRSLSLIQADPAQVQQVVMNLITNASEALGDAVGSIRIETGMSDCDEACLAQSRLTEKAAPGRYVYLEVTDTGCGMDDAVQQRLFDPFFTTKFTGRGLGMAAVLGMVRGHRGAILVSSALGRGTTIRVLFPAPPAQPAPTETSASPGAASTATRLAGTVLIAEDEEPVRNLLTRFLTRQGLRVLAAADGREAVKLFREHSSEITLVLLDVTMPELDGVAALAEMRELRPDLKGLLSSGYDGQEIARRYAEQGAAEFIQKPYRLEELQAVVKRLCSGAIAAGAG